MKFHSDVSSSFHFFPNSLCNGLSVALLAHLLLLTMYASRRKYSEEVPPIPSARFSRLSWFALPLQFNKDNPLHSSYVFSLILRRAMHFPTEPKHNRVCLFLFYLLSFRVFVLCGHCTNASCSTPDTRPNCHLDRASSHHPIDAGIKLSTVPGTPSIFRSVPVPDGWLFTKKLAQGKKVGISGSRTICLDTSPF